MSHRHALLAAMPWRPGAFLASIPYLFVLSAHDTRYLSRCHLGKVILYDTVSKLGWSASIRTHGIKVVIEKLLAEDWEPGEDGAEGQQVPAMVEEDDCVVRLRFAFISCFHGGADLLFADERIVSTGNMENTRRIRYTIDHLDDLYELP